VTELYKGSQESLYVKDALPPWVRSPDSRATRYQLHHIIILIGTLD
jgi:hypothetical protein